MGCGVRVVRTPCAELPMSPARHTSLEAAGAAIVHHLGGHWRNGRGMCLCPAHRDTNPSLSIRVGTRSLLFKCFAGCETSDVLRAISTKRLAVPRLEGGPAERLPFGSLTRSRLARRIWDESVQIRNGRGGRYLDARGLAARPDALRYHPHTPLRVGGVLQFSPAIIASVTQGGEFVAIQRNFLDRRRAALARDLANPRLTLGRPLGGAVELEPARDVLGLAEGVETAMSASQLLGLPVWAVLGAERLHQILIPAAVRRLILLPDNDLSGWRSVARAMNSYRRDALTVEHLWPWGGLNDWSDVLACEMREGRVERK